MLSDTTLRKKYGITRADYDEMLRKQGGTCAICHCHQRYQALAVDHDHKTGFVRGLLCVNCNRGLGRFFDSELRVTRASEYLKEANAVQREPQKVAQQEQNPATGNQLESRSQTLLRINRARVRDNVARATRSVRMLPSNRSTGEALSGSRP